MKLALKLDLVWWCTGLNEFGDHASELAAIRIDDLELFFDSKRKFAPLRRHPKTLTPIRSSVSRFRCARLCYRHGASASACYRELVVMGYAVQRRFPRIPFEQAAEIEYLDRGSRRRVVCSVSLASVACEGLGIAVQTAIKLPRRSRVNVKFELNGEEVSLPGAVAWSRDQKLGIRLLLELARPEARQRWAHWIVEQTNAHRQRGRQARASRRFLRS